MPACPFHSEGEKQDSFPNTLPSNLLWIQIHQASSYWTDSAADQRFIYSPESTGRKEKKKYINEQPNSPHTSLSLHLFLASSYFAWLVTPSPEHPANKKQKSWSFVGIKEGTGSAPKYKQVQTPSLRKIKVVSHVIPPAASSAFKVLGEGRKEDVSGEDGTFASGTLMAETLLRTPGYRGGTGGPLTHEWEQAAGSARLGPRATWAQEGSLHASPQAVWGHDRPRGGGVGNGKVAHGSV